MVQKVDSVEKELIPGRVIIDRDGFIKAVALSYDQMNGDNAPIVIAKGRGNIAQKIINSAKEHDISIVKDSKLASSLMSVSLEQQIPIELYDAVAHIFIYLSQVDKKVGDRYE